MPTERRSVYELVKGINITTTHKGADALGEKYANENHFEIEYYPADWEKFGRSAGPKRNLEMAKRCDYVICFWDGKSLGTKSMIKFAKQFDKPIKIKKI